MASPTTECQYANRNAVLLSNFQLGSSVIVADLAALFRDSDLQMGVGCHSMHPMPSATGPDGCPALFEHLGVDYASGAVASGQSLFRLE
jgi:hypothetical protein